MRSEAEAVLREKYIKSLDTKIKDLELSLLNGNVECLLSLTHRIKGSAGMYGFQEISDYADRLQEVLSHSVDFNEELFKDVYAQLIKSMKIIV